MKKSLLGLMLASLALSANAQEEVTYNFFDPEDCDADGWLWLDTQEKVDKYVGALGSGKKIQLVNADYEIDDPVIPGEKITPKTTVDATVPGYNTDGVAGGEGSKTGGIILPPAYDILIGDGGGILVPMPDCASFNLYLSQKDPDVYTWVEAAQRETEDPDWCVYIWDDGYDWSTDTSYPLSTNYVAWDLNIQDLYYDWGFEGNPDDYESIYGPKGCGGRTALIRNLSEGCDMLVQGLKIRTFTSRSSDTVGEGASVKSLNAVAQKISVKGGIVNLTDPAMITVYSLNGAKVAAGYGKSLDCSALKGIYIVKAGDKTAKAVF